jgi:hypothetical protein
MDDLDFLKEIEGEQSNGESLVAGAEHFLRLKRQVGSESRRYDDLEIEKKAHQIESYKRIDITKDGFAQHMLGGTEKDAGELSALLASTPPSTNCPNCKKEKNACLCKMAKILFDARIKTATSVDGIKSVLKNNPTVRAAALGGATSGMIGAGMGAITNTHDRVGGAITGGLTGAASGAGGGALYHHLNSKLAELREKTAGSMVDNLKNVNPGLVAATGLGALAGGLGTYLASRPKKDSGKSRAEEELEGKVDAQKSQPERGLLSKMHHRNTELEHGYSRAFREHPMGAAAIGTATGALSGYSIGRLAGAISKMRGGQ